MTKLPVLSALVLAAALGSGAFPIYAGEGTAPQTNTNWRPYQRLPDIPDGGGIQSASIAVDNEGTAHLIMMVLSGTNAAYEIWYSNTRYETRNASGFSTPIRIETAPSNNQESVGDPDITCSVDNVAHAVWSHGYGNSDTLVHWSMLPDGSQNKIGFLGGVNSVFYVGPQIACTNDGAVHILEQHMDNTTSPPVNEVEHLVLKGGTVSHFPVPKSNPQSKVRFAVKNGKLCAAWEQITPNPTGLSGNDIYYAQAGYQSGSASWSATQALTTSGTAYRPDVDLDAQGVPHFAWSEVPTNGNPPPPPSIWYSMGGGTKSQISQKNPNSVSPPLPFDQGARIRISGTSAHVFYGGFSHASSPIGLNQWATEEPLKAPNDQQLRKANQADPSNPLPSTPWEVSEHDGRFDLVDPKFYIRSYDTFPDGASFVPAFPGAQVNTVPLSGSLQYRLNLFSTKGVGPSTSLGLTYNTKKSIASLNGPGWTMDHMMTITVGGDSDNITLTLPNGFQINFTYDTTAGYTIADKSFGFVASIQKLGATWSMKTDGGAEYVFDQFGKLGTVQEPTGNMLVVHYYTSGPSTGMPSQIVDMLGNGGPGRITQLFYGTGADARHVVLVVDPAGNEYQLNYATTVLGNQLSSVNFLGVPEKPTYAFQYGTNGYLSNVTMPRGNTYVVHYDSAGRVDYTQDPPAPYLLDTDGDGATPGLTTAKFQVVYNDDTDPGFAAKFHTRVINRRNNPTIYVFDAANNFGVIEEWDAAALAGAAGIHPVLRTFDTFGNVLTLQDRWGFTTSYTYVQKSSTDPAPWLRNLLQSVTKPLVGMVDSYTYTPDAFGNVQTHTTYATPTGGSGTVARTTTYGYDPYGRVTSIQFPDLTRPDGVVQSGVKSTYLYGPPRLQLVQFINEEGHATTYSNFDPLHGLAQSVLRDGGTQPEVTGYDKMGNITMTQRPHGGSGNDAPGPTLYGLDGLYRVTSITDPAGQMTFRTYDLESRLLSVQPPAGSPTTAAYDSRGFVSGGTTPDGSWGQVVDANGNVRGKSTLRGAVTYTDYDSLDRVVAVRAPGSPTGGMGGGGSLMTTQWTWDQFDAKAGFSSLETRVGMTTKRVTTTTYDALHRPISVQEPDLSTVIQTFYDEQDHVVAVQRTFGGVFQTATLTFRDARDRVERVRIQDSAYGTPPVRTSDAVTIFNRVGSVTQTVDPLGNPTANTGPAAYAHKITRILDARERVAFQLDGYGVLVTANIWGDDDLLVETRVPDPSTNSSDLVPAETRTYTARKELRSVLNRNNVGLVYTYNAIQGQVNTAIQGPLNGGPLQRVTQTTYYPDTERVKDVILAQGTPAQQITTSVWQTGLLAEVHVYNPQSGQNDAVYRSYYDQADRLERLDAPLVDSELHYFNEFGEPSQFVAGTNTILYTYNALGQRLTSSWVGTAYKATETRSYNGLGLVETISDGVHAKTMLYDHWLGTPSLETFSVQGSVWKSQVHTYDVAKNYVGFTDSANGQHQWIYDANNRIQTIKYGAAQAPLNPVCQTLFTPGGLLFQTTLSSASGAPIAVTTHSYDGLGRKIAQETVQSSTGAVLAGFAWEYDDLDQVTVAHLNHLGVLGTFSYDERHQLLGESWSSNNSGQSPPPYANQIGGAPTGQLSAASTPSRAMPGGTLAVNAQSKTYAYDAAGNRTSVTIGGVATAYHYNSASQLLSDASTTQSVTHSYDEWGNEHTRTTTTSAPGGPQVTETYGYNYLNLMSSYLKSTTSGTSTTSVSWQYDFWPSGERYSKTNLANTSPTELYVPRFGDVATEYSTPSTLKNSYVQGINTDQKYTRVSATGDRRHYLGDSVGTLCVTLTDSAATAETSLKDVWGNQIAGGMTERYGFAQREIDAESGLVSMRARMYDPVRGRFTQLDPITGRRPTTHYTYAANDPIRKSDPSGAYSWDDFANDAKYLGGKVVKGGINVLRAVTEPVAQVFDIVDTAAVATTNAFGWTDVQIDDMYFFSMLAASERNRVLNGEDWAHVATTTGNTAAGDALTLGNYSRAVTHWETYQAVADGRLDAAQGTERLLDYELDAGTTLLWGGVLNEGLGRASQSAENSQGSWPSWDKLRLARNEARARMEEQFGEVGANHKTLGVGEEPSGNLVFSGSDPRPASNRVVWKLAEDYQGTAVFRLGLKSKGRHPHAEDILRQSGIPLRRVSATNPVCGSCQASLSAAGIDAVPPLGRPPKGAGVPPPPVATEDEKR